MCGARMVGCDVYRERCDGRKWEGVVRGVAKREGRDTVSCFY